MIFSLFRPKTSEKSSKNSSGRPPGDTISTLYGMIVAQARLPTFYRDYAVADTVNGRFDLIVLHLALVMDRLTVDGRLQSPGQEIFDLFCTDMDANLREMGISDLKVPKEMRRMGEAFYGRSQAYLKGVPGALAGGIAGDRALCEALTRNIYGAGPSEHPLAPRLAAYVVEAVRDLRMQEMASIAAGRLHFPDPSATVVAG